MHQIAAAEPPSLHPNEILTMHFGSTGEHVQHWAPLISSTAWGQPRDAREAVTHIERRLKRRTLK